MQGVVNGDDSILTSNFTQAMDQFWAIIVFFMLFLYLHLIQGNLAWLDARDKVMDRFEQLSGVWFHTVFVFASDMYE